MEHVPGETLADVLRKEGRLHPNRATSIAASVADALGVAHAARIVHRDVKPANVMLTPDGRTKLMDPGIARNIDGESITHASSILGTAGYVSPEQARGDPVDHRSDISPSGASCTRCSRAASRSRLRIRSPWPTSTCRGWVAPNIPRAIDPACAGGGDPACDGEGAWLEVPERRGDGVRPRRSNGARGAAHHDHADAPRAGDAHCRQPTPTPFRGGRIVCDARPLVPVLLGLAALAVLGGLAYALFGNDPPAGREGPRTRRVLRIPFVVPFPIALSVADPAPVDPVQGAVAALQAVVARRGERRNHQRQSGTGDPEGSR